MNYRKVWEKVNGPIPKDGQGRRYEIHHIDGNRNNNSIDNLRCVSIQEHYDIHYSQGDFSAAAIIADRMNKAFSGWRHKEETIQRMKDAAKDRPPVSEETKEKLRGPHSEERKKKIKDACNTPEFLEKMREYARRRLPISEEVREKLKGPKSEEHKQNMRKPKKNKENFKKSEEWKQKVRETKERNGTNKHSEKTKQKLKDAWERRKKTYS